MCVYCVIWCIYELYNFSTNVGKVQSGNLTTTDN